MGVATLTPPAQRVGEELVYPDGRHELADDSSIRKSYLYNDDLAPVAIKKRTWSTYNYIALWVGMAHNLPTYGLAAGLVFLGMAWYQAIITISLANFIVLIPMLLNSHAGTKYGIPFPVFARASFGVFGANVAAILRAFIACGWFGIQTWIGGQALYTLAGALFGSGWINSSMLAGQHWTLWLSFAIFWALNIVIITRGINAVRRFENWAAPFVILVAVFLLVWMVSKAGGLGPIVSQPGKVGWGAAFWKLFFPSLMAQIAFWSTLSLNMPDFTRFGKSQRAQALGQLLGLPTTMTVFPLLAVLITSATVTVYGSAIWDPIALTAKFSNPIVIVLALFTLAVATLSVNIAANVVSPSYDFSNLWPKAISFRFGGLITGVLGIVIQPWRLYSDPHVYIFTWLGFYGGALGAIAGVLIADYWYMRQTQLKLGDLYRSQGAYRYAAGFNFRAIVALLVGGVLAVGGAYTAPGTQGPFPAKGVIPFLYQPFTLYDYSWVVGLVAAFVVYLALSALFPAAAARRQPRTAAAT
ncbi:MAG TPA: NCS1 family nucleobase:cation symporter-1 [Candidatus Angelobacter sp.]|nr:NCS1 family nucleobase:cation symporter-1 [Candidatus Angelobacter sp.]